MRALPYCLLLLASGAIALARQPAQALPGQRTETVRTWIRAHPTLQPALGDGLTVENSNAAAQRFQFSASVLPPGRLSFVRNRGIIRSERFLLYDVINGVSAERLAESLRVIYGLDIYRDYQQANPVYAYPSFGQLELGRRLALPGVGGVRGELRVGDRFAYWTELSVDDFGEIITGQVTVFLKEDLSKLETELRRL
ncbi:MAG: hypothetical protein HC910_07105 [Spirulinaceae cyanobacterium SM2_1_0]|nr:hypothetical protein [Spirulinaceae cyanobacterium SM2_1_0]